MKSALLMVVSSLAVLSTHTHAEAPASLDTYNLVWTSPSEDASGSMPIGNGEVVLNVWVERATGDLLFYIARSDALSEISRILKLGRVRVHWSSAPFKDASDFKQSLLLRDGLIEVTGNGAKATVYVDSGQHAIHVDALTPHADEVVVTLESWRKQDRVLPQEEMASAWSVRDAPFPLRESADVFARQGRSTLIWYHRNMSSVVPKLWEEQALTGLAGTFDPLIDRIFGGSISAPRLFVNDAYSLKTQSPQRDLELTIATHTAQSPSVESWVRGLQAVGEASPDHRALERTKEWWRGFWNRSWVFVTGGEEAHLITQGYLLQRFVQACQNRGAYPAKFNGGYYTVEPTPMGKPFNPDFRNWGDAHWFQNVRHIVHPMLAGGDFDQMEPFFRLYESNRLLCESRSRLYHDTEGAYFPETMTVYGTYSGGDYGWDRTGHTAADVLCPWWQYAWNQGPELVALMLDRWDYTRDEKFLRDRVLPMAESVLRYFDTRFRRDSEGRLILDPTQAVETYWDGVVNDMPSTAGLVAITRRLCSLPRGLVPAKQLEFFQRMKSACPTLPLKETAGQQELAPAQKYDPKTSNCENPELYAVWPFRLATLARPELLEEARRAYEHRLNHLDVGWGYDGNAAALLGLTEEAARILLVKCQNSNPKYRWPATWGPNFDWLPDQNHGGNLLETTNLMLLQAEPLEAGGAIRVLPAWPKKWDVEFKLHAPGNTTIHCIAQGGKLVKLEVTPPGRAKDVIRPNGW